MRLQAIDAALAPLKTGAERIQQHIRAQWEKQRNVVNGFARILLAHTSMSNEKLPRLPCEDHRYNALRSELLQPWMLENIQRLIADAPKRSVSSKDLSAAWLLDALSEKYSKAEIIGYECQNLLTLCVEGKAPEAVMSAQALSAHCDVPDVFSHSALCGLLFYLRKVTSVLGKLRDMDARRAVYEIMQAVYFQEGQMPGVDEERPDEKRQETKEDLGAAHDHTVSMGKALSRYVKEHRKYPYEDNAALFDAGNVKEWLAKHTKSEITGEPIRETRVKQVLSETSCWVNTTPGRSNPDDLKESLDNVVAYYRDHGDKSEK